MTRFYHRFIFPILASIFGWSYVSNVKIYHYAKYKCMFVEPIEPLESFQRVSG